MVDRFQSGALFGHVYRLDSGFSVRLRLVRSSDAAAIRDLLARQGTDPPSELDISRLVHSDPRSRFVICATGLVEMREALLGFGSISLDGHPTATPDLVIVDDGPGEELRRLLTRTLVGWAAVAARSRAA